MWSLMCCLICTISIIDCAGVEPSSDLQTAGCWGPNMCSFGQHPLPGFMTVYSQQVLKCYIMDKDTVCNGNTNISVCILFFLKIKPPSLSLNHAVRSRHVPPIDGEITEVHFQ